MTTEIKVHSIQAQILTKLLFHPSARFAELNEQKLDTDHFNFHLQSLVKAELVEKDTSGKYKLTTEGKEFANRFDTEEKQIEKQPKVSVLIVATRQSKGKEQLLIQQRLKNPYYGYHGFIGGKVRWGETIEEAANRELREESGLSAKVTLKVVRHKMDYDKDGNLLEDKIFMQFLAENCKGELIEKFEGGENIWLTRDEIAKLPNLFPDVLRALGMMDSDSIQFLEKKFIVEGY